MISRIVFFCLIYNISFSQPGENIFMFYSDRNMLLFHKDTNSFEYEINSIDLKYLLSNGDDSKIGVNYITDFINNFFHIKIINKKKSDTTTILFELQSTTSNYVYKLELDSLVKGNYYFPINTICSKKVEVGKIFRNGCEICFNDIKIQKNEVFNRRILAYNNQLEDNQIYKLYKKEEYRRNKKKCLIHLLNNEK